MASASILPLFPLLSSHDPVTRLDASVSLLTALPLSSTAAAAPAQVDADTPYAIKRLVTGLGSSNDAARQGFAVALAELLARLSSQQASDVLPLVIASSTPTAGSDAREERDLLFARVLGLHAVLRSGVLYRPSQENVESFKEVALALLAVSGKKSWIRESAFWVLLEGVKALFLLESSAIPPWRDEVAQWLVQRFLVDSRERARGWSPEKVALVLVLQSCQVAADWASVLSPSFPSGNPLARSTLTTLAQAIKGSSTEADSGASKGPKMGSNAVKTSKGSTPIPGAAPHFVWTEIFDIYFPDNDRKMKASETDGANGRAKWSEVWRILVDQSLFAPPSLPLKATGFALLSLAIQRLPPAEVPTLFGEGVMRTFTNHLRKSGDGEKTLNRVAEKLAASLPPFLAINPAVSLPMLKALVAPPHGSPSFDHRTVEKVVAKLDVKGVRGWVKYLKDFVLGEEKTVEEREAIPNEAEDQKALVASRLWAFDQLLHIAKVSTIEKDDDILAGLLEFFAVLGWFEVKKSGKGARSYVPVPAFGEALQAAARSRFFSIVTALTATSTETTWLSRALGLLDNLSADSKHFTHIAETDATVVEARDSVRSMYAELAGDDKRRRTARSLVEGILLLSYDEGEDASEALEGVKDSLRTLFPELFPSSSSSEADEDGDGDAEMDGGEEPEPATVLIDLLLELLHRPSAFTKSVAQTVFTGFATEIGEQGIELIIEQIRPEEIVADDEDVTMANGDHQPEASTSRVKSTPNGKAKAAESNSSDDEGDDDDLDESDADEEVDEAFRNELLAALQASGVAEEFDAQDDDGDSDEEEELLDDDQMMALDDKLADIFRLQGGGRKGKKADRMDDLHFRLRVVDLLESLARQRTPNPLLVHIVIPLFSIIRRTSTIDKELQDKSLKLLRQIVAARKDPPTPASPQGALEALEELHSVAQTVDTADLTSLCSQTSIFLVKAALASPSADAATSASIAKVFGDSFEQYLSKKNSKTRVQPALTLEFAKRSPSCAWPLFTTAVALGHGDSTAVNAFRRMQAFEVAQALLTSHAALKTPEAKANIVAGISMYRDAVHGLLASALNDEATTSLDAARLKELVKFALGGARLTIASSDAETARKIWRGTDFAPLLDQVRSNPRFKHAIAIQSLLKQLLAVLGADVPKATKKRKNSEAVEEKAVEEPKAKKSRKAKVTNLAPEVEVEVEEDDDEVNEAAAEALVVEAAQPKSEKRKKSKKEKKG